MYVSKASDKSERGGRGKNGWSIDMSQLFIGYKSTKHIYLKLANIFYY